MNQEMPTFDVSSIPTEFNPLSNTLDSGSEVNLYAKDSTLYVTFKTEAVLNPAESTKQGRPIYDDVDMITVRTPGSQLTSVVDVAKRYTQGRPVLAAKYRDWKSGQMQAASGTPLENFPFLFTKPSMIAELKFRNIFTVEQLAELSDSAKQTVMGGHELCRIAAEWLASSKAAAQDDEKEQLKTRLAEMERKMAELTGDQPTVKSISRRKAAQQAAPVPAPVEVEQVPDFMKE